MNDKIDQEKWTKLSICCQILSAYLGRSHENKVHDVEWEAIKTACEFLTKHLK